MGEDTSKPLKTTDELRAALTAVDTNGNVWFLEPNKPAELAFANDGINPELHALLASAHILFRVGADCRDMFEVLIAFLEEKGLDDIVPSILAHQVALNTAMRCATEGIEKVLGGRN